jgi:tetratricopeptide (TPR) repeat protein
MTRRPVIPSTPEAAIAALQAMDAAMRAGERHDAEFRTTDAGQRAFALKEQARNAAQAGVYQVAIPLLQQAIALFPPESDGVALASLRHELAKVLGDDPIGHSHRRHLVRELLELAVASQARRRYPQRWAISASLLASTLRGEAMGERDEARHELLLDRAEAFFNEAIAVAEECQSWWDATGYWLNLGNLFIQRGKTEAAIDAYERSLQCARPFKKAAAFREKPDLTRALVGLGHRLKERGHRNDERRAIAMLEEAVQLDHPVAAHDARFVLADWLIDAKERERAARLLEQIDFERLHPRHLDRAVRLFERVGLVAVALLRLHGLVARSLTERSDTIADLLADRAERLVQERALVLVETLIRNKQAVNAFLVLDNTSALRFAETTHRYTLCFRDPISRGLRIRFEAAGITASVLEGVLDRLRGLSPKRWLELVAEEAACLREDRRDPRAALFTEACSALEAAIAGGTLDLTPIERALEGVVQRAHRARMLLAKREAGRNLRLLEEDVERTELHRLLAAEPGQVFLRFTLGRREWMIVIAVFLEGDNLRARSTSVRLPTELFDLVEAYEREPGDADLAARLTTRLAQVDLTPVLPDGHHRVAVVLPSSLLARLPLAALGPPGRRLLDRFEAVTWLPSLFPLRTRQESHRPRHGIVTVVPGERGDTALHASALQRALPEEQRLEEGAATVEAVQVHARRADVVCFYAHGTYVHGRMPELGEGQPPGPTICLADHEQLTLVSLSDQWEGAERIELWCCRTGVNLPMDPMGVLVDEAFGLDYEFLRVGARSAIGSLYTVPELITAVMVDRFRERLLEGANATVALADAQRDWITRALPRLVALLRDDPVEGFVRFAAERGWQLPPGAPADADHLQRLWSCPMAWASFRFVGVAERRSLAAWEPEWERPLTEAEDREVEVLVSGLAS